MQLGLFQALLWVSAMGPVSASKEGRIDAFGLGSMSQLEGGGQGDSCTLAECHLTVRCCPPPNNLQLNIILLPTACL